MAYFAPTDLNDALSILREHRPKIIAGCTDYFPSKNIGEPAISLLDISRIEDLHGIEKIGDHWRIGAATTWSDLIAAKLPSYFRGLKLAAREVGSVQIQNSATIVGNICNASPAADGIPPLLTLDAEVEVSDQTRQRIIPLSAFILGPRQIDLRPDEFVTSIRVPLQSDQVRSHFLKLGSRTYLVISIAMISVTVRLARSIIDSTHIAVGSCTPVAVRLTKLEKFLTGQTVHALKCVVLPDNLFSELAPITDVRATAQYRKAVVPELCRRAILQAAEVGPP